MPKHLSRHFATVLLTALFLLIGCGQKGPLYLEKQTTKEAPSSAPQTDKKATTDTENQ